MYATELLPVYLGYLKKLSSTCAYFRFIGEEIYKKKRKKKEKEKRKEKKEKYVLNPWGCFEVPLDLPLSQRATFSSISQFDVVCMYVCIEVS